MTEDEKKIQEMAQLGTMDCRGKDCIKCQQNHPHEICWPYRRAQIYYQEGYRKAGEVMKKTAKEIIKYLRENGQFAFDYPDDPVQNVSFSESIFETLEDMFGVEEEE